MGQIDVDTVLLEELTYRGPVRGDRTATGTINSGLIANEFGFNTGKLKEILLLVN